MYFQGDEDGGPLEGIDRRGFHASSAHKGEDFDDNAKEKSTEIATTYCDNEGDEVGKDKKRVGASDNKECKLRGNGGGGSDDDDVDDGGHDDGKRDECESLCEAG